MRCILIVANLEGWAVASQIMFYSSGKNGDSPTNNSNGTENSANGSSTSSGAGQSPNPLDKDSHAPNAPSKTPKEKQTSSIGQ